MDSATLLSSTLQTDRYWSHYRALHFYVPLFVLFLLIPCFLLLGTTLRAFSQRASAELRTIHRFIVFAGVMAGVGVTPSLFQRFQSVWVFDGLLGGLLFWTLGATYITFRKR